MIAASATLYAELWVSLASLLRSYTALHGLNGKRQATVELGEEAIIVRAADRWLRLARYESDIAWTRQDGHTGLMRFTIDGKLKTHIGDIENEDREVEMDMQAEAWAREMMR